MPDHIKDLAHGRLGLAKEFISDGARLGDIIRPGALSSSTSATSSWRSTKR